MARKIVDNSMTAPRGMQNTSCNWTGSGDFGRLIPIHIEELNPTDKVVTCKPRMQMQLLSLAAPTFGKLDAFIHYFFVPSRLLWKDFNDYHSRQGAGKNSTPPYVTLYDIAHTYQQESSPSIKRAMFKHLTSLGLPPFFDDSSFNDEQNTANLRKLTQLKFRAYEQIWWDFYRDPEVLRDENKSDYINDAGGHQPNDNRTINSYLPKYRGITNNWIASLFADNGQLQDGLGIPTAGNGLNAGLAYSDSSWAGLVQNGQRIAQNLSAAKDVSTNIVGEIDPKTYRTFEALTRLSERMSLAGKRQIDALFARFGVKPEWSKLNMCQYVGGAKTEIYVQDIISNANTQTANPGGGETIGSPLGAKGGSGYAALGNLNINYTAEEDGYLVGILSIVPHVHYVQGIDKSWFRNNREDWFTKSLERTGQVAVRKDEIATTYNVDNWGMVYDRSEDGDTFAFTQPYYELKKGQDILAGDFMYYHQNQGDDDEQENKDLAYMHSMEMYIDYPTDRNFDYASTLINPLPFNKIFNYLGGGIWSDSDDHFHICIDKEIIKETVMDGYAVPTIETTEDPHAAKAAVGKDTVL